MLSHSPGLEGPARLVVWVLPAVGFLVVFLIALIWAARREYKDLETRAATDLAAAQAKIQALQAREGPSPNSATGESRTRPG